MRATLSAFQQVTRVPGVEGAALVGVQQNVLSDRLDPFSEHLIDIASTARHVFRETQPALHFLDLRFERGRVLLLPLGRVILLLRARAEIEANTLVGLIRPHTAALSDFESSAPSLPPPSLAPAAPPSLAPAAPPSPAPAAPDRLPQGAAIEALQRVIDRARQDLGGAVLRNYLRRTQRDLQGRYPALEHFDIDLSGQITPRGAQPPDEASLAAAAGVWCRATLDRAAIVVPELGRLDLRAVVGRLAPGLESAGFFDSPSSLESTR
jgi:hypothetical protein